MSKKNIVNLNVRDEEQRNIMFTKCFLIALKNNSVTIKNNKMYMDVEDTQYVVDASEFLFVWKPSISYIYREDFPKMLRENNININSIKNLFAWTSPIFDETLVEKDRDVAVEKFETKLKSDEKYLELVRKTTIDFINTLGLEVRREYIDRFIDLNILRNEDRIPLQYYATCTPMELSNLFRDKVDSENDRMEIVSQAFREERRKQNAKDRSVSVPNKRIINLVDLLNASSILNIFMSGDLSDKELVKTKITKNDLIHQRYDVLLAILTDKNANLPVSLKITSKDLINEYGRSLNGNQIYKLASYGYIEPQDLIEVYETNKVLRLTDYDEAIFEDEDLQSFYTPSVLIKMKKEGKLSSKFMEKYLEMLDFENNPELYSNQSKCLIEELKKLSEDNGIEEDVLELFELGLCNAEIAREQISNTYIETKFLNGEIEIEKILEYYKKGLIDDKTITTYYSPLDIIELYESGTVNGSCLTVVKDSNLLMGEFVDNKIATEDFFALYLSGNISVMDLDDAIQLSEREIDITGFIDENVPFEKIKELFLGYLIDYSLILRLYNQQIINDDQIEEIKNAANTKKFFQDLQDGKKYKVVTSRESQGTSKSKSGTSVVKNEESFLSEIELISKLLRKNVESEPYSLIESYNVNGRATSLNNYRIFGNEELDGIVILQKSKRENAVYVMNALQMMYFLRGKENAEGEIEIQNRMKDKAYLKTIEGVEVVEHTEHFARNLVDAASRVSPKINESVRTSDRKYISEVNQMVIDMREKYLENKAKDRDED